MLVSYRVLVREWYGLFETLPVLFPRVIYSYVICIVDSSWSIVTGFELCRMLEVR
jgi:hypothetical protein